MTFRFRKIRVFFFSFFLKSSSSNKETNEKQTNKNPTYPKDLSFSLFFQLSSKKERNQKTKHKTKKDLPIHPSRICWWFSLTCLLGYGRSENIVKHPIHLFGQSELLRMIKPKATNLLCWPGGPTHSLTHPQKKPKQVLTDLLTYLSWEVLKIKGSSEIIVSPL